MHSEDGSAPNEIELIKAADLSKTTTRMISSDWGVPTRPQCVLLFPWPSLSVTNSICRDLGSIPSVAHKHAAKAALDQTTSLQHTRFFNGYFMDYWGIPRVPSYLARTPLVFWLDIANNKAAIPGSGNVPVVFTHTRDVAKFVAAALDLPKWEEETYVKGDKLTWNEFVKLVEEVKGEKIEVVYDGVEMMKKGETTELPAQVPMYQFIPKQFLSGMAAGMGLWFEEGLFDMKPAKWLDEELGIEALKVKEMLVKAWGK